MAEEEEKQEQEKPEEEKPEEAPAEEKFHKTEINVDMSGVQKQLAELAKQIAELKVKEQEEPAPVEEPEKKEEPADETKGEVAPKEPEEEETSESLVLEQAETGKGFAIWRDYSKEDSETSKLKKLIR